MKPMITAEQAMMEMAQGLIDANKQIDLASADFQLQHNYHNNVHAFINVSKLLEHYNFYSKIMFTVEQDDGNSEEKTSAQILAIMASKMYTANKNINMETADTAVQEQYRRNLEIIVDIISLLFEDLYSTSGFYY